MRFSGLSWPASKLPSPPPPPPGYLPFQVVVPKADAVLARAPKYSGVFDGARRALELQAVRCT